MLYQTHRNPVALLIVIHVCRSAHPTPHSKNALRPSPQIK